MDIGVPREIKTDEARVSLTPDAVSLLTGDGHTVVIEAGAGSGAGFSDDEYRGAGAMLVPLAADVFDRTDLIVKVKEPLSQEYSMLREDHVLFTYLHLAASRELTDALRRIGLIAIAYETVELPDSSLPLLSPMSEIAGRMAAHMGAHFLMRPHGRRGVLAGGVPGVAPADVVVIGAGVVGSNAARLALGFGASVTVLDVNPQRLRRLDERFTGARLTTLHSTPRTIERVTRFSDIIIGAVLTTGERAPTLITQESISAMKPGAVIVDVSIDQGGIAETKLTMSSTTASPTCLGRFPARRREHS